MDAVFLALACPTRRRILDVVMAKPGCGVKHVAKFFAMSRIGVLKHLRVLVDAGLLTSEKEGRNRKLFFNCVPIQMIYDRWTTEYSALWASRMTEVKYRVEAKEKVHGRK
jgi:predicted transcriptional regulator